MGAAQQAIKVTPAVHGWTWEVIDKDHGAVARGVADGQVTAMESAWRAARSFSGPASGQFPEILVGDRKARH